MARHISRNSITSRRRLPSSTLETKDCGRPSREARSCWVAPARLVAATNRSSKRRYPMVWVDFKGRPPASENRRSKEAQLRINPKPCFGIFRLASPQSELVRWGLVKEQYVGDVNDYRKYALLRHLAKAGGIRVGVCWILTPPDDRPDGDMNAYLDQPDRWQAYDPDLFKQLKSVRDYKGALHAHARRATLQDVPAQDRARRNHAL
jgi:hypothetical protein